MPRSTARRRRRSSSATASTGRSRGLIAGIGDDCAVLQLPPAHEALVTTDFSLEGIHFRRDWHPPEIVGHRCLTRGLSDIAAMGGEPVAAFLSLALPRDLSQAWVARFLNGFLRLARQFKVPLAGGDTAESPAGILADIVVLGSVPRGKAILRSGARPADRIYVSGELGAAAATLTFMVGGKPDAFARANPVLSAMGKRIVHCHGVFDLLHLGHIRHFEEARQAGDVLVVTLTPDQWVNKGPHRPAFPAGSRHGSAAASPWPSGQTPHAPLRGCGRPRAPAPAIS